MTRRRSLSPPLHQPVVEVDCEEVVGPEQQQQQQEIEVTVVHDPTTRSFYRNDDYDDDNNNYIINSNSSNSNNSHGGSAVSLKRAIYTCILISWVLSHQSQAQTRGVAAAAATTRSRTSSSYDTRQYDGDGNDLDLVGAELESYRNLDEWEDEEVTDTDNADDEDVLILSLVDGTMLGLSRTTGKTLWKQSAEVDSDDDDDYINMDSHYHRDQQNNPNNNMRPKSAKQRQSQNKNKNMSDGGKVMRKPLISTTTTTKSSSASASGQDWRTAAVPSIDGRVYLTASSGRENHSPFSSSASSGSTSSSSSSSSSSERKSHQTKEVTATSTVRELVARAPFVDARGRFYVGSRHASAAAIDRDTGDVLRAVSADEHQDPTTSVDLEDYSVVWVGRVDFHVSIYDARTGEMDVQFSTSEVMSVNDMLHGYNDGISGGGGGGTGPEGYQQHAPRLMLPHGTSGSGGGEILSTARTSLLVATPNGNVALRNPNTGLIEWVANETFDTPVAFAVDAVTGISLGVDILPDAPVPSSSSEYLSRELERQMQAMDNQVGGGGRRGGGAKENIEEDKDQTIVGALPSGQLFAMPLGKRHSSLTWATSQSKLPLGLPHPSTHSASFSSSSHAGDLTSQLAKLPNTMKRQATTTSQHIMHDSNHHPNSMTHKKPCIPSSPTYPGCLVGNIHREDNFLRPVGEESGQLEQHQYENQNQHHQHHDLQQKQQHANHYGDDGLVNLVYHPELGYLPAPEQGHVHPPPPQQGSSFGTFFRIMASWLPPTMALIFVLSFELGRRQRLKDEERNEEKVRQQKIQGSSTTFGDVGGTLTFTNDSMQQIGVIQVSEEVLGFGGHGTVVYKGLLDSRKVAVKRMLKAYHASADREISLLIESDGHPNVVRYFLKEVRGDFVYLALELCDMSLHDLIVTLAARRANMINPVIDQPLSISPAMKRTLFQIASGVRHLHSLRIVHRDLKPANILLGQNNRPDGKNDSLLAVDDNSEGPVFTSFERGEYVAKISDMGLGKQLTGQSSFGMSTLANSSIQGQNDGDGSNMVGAGPGSVGWQAPEVMAQRWSPESLPTRSDGSSGAQDSSADISPMDGTLSTRTSRSVDIFSLGCIFYCAMMPGSHPFGEWFEREANIMRNKPVIEALETLSPDAYDLVKSMINRDPKFRPNAKQICEHPFFWKPARRLAFLCDISDRLEFDGGGNDDVPADVSSMTLAIERSATRVVGTAWDTKLDEGLISNVQRFRTYDPSSVRDILRLIRNKHHHYDELPVDVKERMGSNAEGLMNYFEKKFPRLIMHCYNTSRDFMIKSDPLALKYGISPSSRQIIGRLERIKSIGGEEDLEFVSSKENQGVQSANTNSPQEVATKKQIEDLVNSADEELTNTERCELLTKEVKNEIDKVASGARSDSPTISPLLIDESVPAKQESASEPICSTEVNDSQPAAQIEHHDDLVIWQGSTAAKSLNCRGWARSDDEWIRRTDATLKKRNANVTRCAEDPKFRTRLCNHWDESMGTFCTMRRKNKCIFAHGPVELRVKEGKRNRWGKLVNKDGDNSNPNHSGGEDTYGAARSIENVRKEEGKWNTSKASQGRGKQKGRPGSARKKQQP